ncbi:hypothetical protein D9613_012814 [Agrocybe pediades]|uniref:Nephrocystin 3-like N-terminal domain-containing protein n=1 Tax=Agrocybe pediades TaxID=84607 RepID=A0A8H4R3V2_9AGAR|nr:hypothetical protein D9613_012814 [Agrocybe pediades]
MAHSGTSCPPLINLTNSIVAGGTFTQHINQHNYTRSGERPGYARLLENVATAALHDSVHNVDPPKCYPNTRVAIMQNIHDWTLGNTEELSGKPILWLNGAAGAGKSAIARSVAERCSAEGLLLGTFFFGAAESTRNHIGKLVATLSYQISLVLPEFRDAVATFVEEDPLIFARSISTQFNTLIIRPFWRVLTNHSVSLSTIPCLIIIDGLDECSAVNSQRDLLLTLHEVTNTTSLIRFLVCSRPESHLNNTFSLSRMVPIIYKIFLDNDYAAREDIRVYLTDKFQQIKEGHSFRRMLPDPWPTPEMVDDLIEKSSGQFIYAATVVRYLESPRHRPDQRLHVIFGLRPPFKDLPFTELDALYRLIISKAEDLSTVLDILAFPTLYGLFYAADIEAILQLEQGSVRVLLADLHSIVTFYNRGDVAFLHKSLEDFLSEPQRAGDLYRDLSRARQPIEQVVSKLEGPATISADYISSDILQAAQQFPMFEFCTPLLLYRLGEQTQTSSDTDWWFIRPYFPYLYYIKDLSYVHLTEDLKGMIDEDFGANILEGISRSLVFLDDWRPCLYVNDIAKISHDLIGDIRKEVIFAMSATYCLEVLCNEQRVSWDEGRIYGLTRHDRRKKREHPWHWRQMVPRPPSLGNRLALVGFRRPGDMHYEKLKLTRVRKALRTTIRYRYENIRVITMREYSREKYEPAQQWWHLPVNMKDGYRQQWPQFIFLLDLLPRILPLAGRYEPLVDMCRKKCLSSLSQFWPKKSRRARRAIDSYLRRMDSQEGMEM